MAVACSSKLRRAEQHSWKVPWSCSHSQRKHGTNHLTRGGLLRPYNLAFFAKQTKLREETRRRWSPVKRSQRSGPGTHMNSHSLAAMWLSLICFPSCATTKQPASSSSFFNVKSKAWSGPSNKKAKINASSSQLVHRSNDYLLAKWAWQFVGCTQLFAIIKY